MNTHTKLTHTHTNIRSDTHLSMLLWLNNISKSKTLEASPPVRISPDPRSFCSYLPRLSLLWAGATVPLQRQGSLAFPAPGRVRGGGPLPVLPVSIHRLVVTPALSCSSSLFTCLLGRRVLSVAGVRWSVSRGPKRQSATDLMKKFKESFTKFPRSKLQLGTWDDSCDQLLINVMLLPFAICMLAAQCECRFCETGPWIPICHFVGVQIFMKITISFQRVETGHIFSTTNMQSSW